MNIVIDVNPYFASNIPLTKALSFDDDNYDNDYDDNCDDC